MSLSGLQRGETDHDKWLGVDATLDAPRVLTTAMAGPYHTLSAGRSLAARRRWTPKYVCQETMSSKAKRALSRMQGRLFPTKTYQDGSILGSVKACEGKVVFVVEG